MRVGVAAALGLFMAASRGNPARPAEYAVKAAFLYNFTRFVEWPESAFRTAESPLVIGVWDTNVFGPELIAIEQRQVHSRPISVLQCRSDDDFARCHVLFLNCPNRKQVRDALTAVSGKPVLTVGETGDFTGLGGGVSFYASGSRIRFEISSEVCGRAGLKVSSKLLQLSRPREPSDPE